MADFFSRNPDCEFHEAESNDICLPSSELDKNIENQNKMINALNLEKSFINDLKNIHKMQSEDEMLIKYVNNKIIVNKNNFMKYNYVWFHRTLVNNHWKIMVPEMLINKLILEEHNKINHGGVYKTITMIKNKF